MILVEFAQIDSDSKIQRIGKIATLMNLKQVDAYYMKGNSNDSGSKLGYLKANVGYALRQKELGPEYKAYLKSLNL